LAASPLSLIAQLWMQLTWYCPRIPRSARSAARAGCTMPCSSVARLCRNAGAPFHCQGARNRVMAFDITGSCRAACAHERPPSADTSTDLILPLPDQAMPEIS